MDPTAAVTEIREIIARAEKREGMDSDDVGRIQELWSALDQWMSRGGFLPGQWRR